MSSTTKDIIIEVLNNLNKKGLLNKETREKEKETYKNFEEMKKKYIEITNDLEIFLESFEDLMEKIKKDFFEYGLIVGKIVKEQ